MVQARFFPGSKSHVFNAGAPVWGIDWRPIHPDDRSCKCNSRIHPPKIFVQQLLDHQHKQYLAVAPFPSHDYSPMIGSRVQRPSSACIQLWSLARSPIEEDAMAVDGALQDTGEIRCELVLCLDSGPAHDLKWCPLPANDSTAVGLPSICQYMIDSAIHVGCRTRRVMLLRGSSEFWAAPLRTARLPSMLSPTPRRSRFPRATQ